MDNSGVTDDIEQIEQFVQSDWWVTALTAIGIVIVTAILAHLIVRLVKKLIKYDKNDILPSSTIIINMIRGVIWFLGICAILAICFGVDISAAIAALGVGGIALSLGLQDTISNIMGGLQVTFMKIIVPGDNIEVGDNRGVVRDITWHHTTIITSTGEEVIIPNSVINKEMLVHLAPAESVAAMFTVRSAGEDLDGVAAAIEKTCLEALEPEFVVTKEPTVLFTSVTEFGFQGKVLFAIVGKDKTNAALDVVIRAIAPLTRDINTEEGTNPV